ncbi:MAG: carbohydrate porin [Opitutaceae bacterium]
MLHLPHTCSRQLYLTFASTGLALGVSRAQPVPATDRFDAPLVQSSLTVTGELWHNASGGLSTGSRWNSLADLTLAVDLTRLGAPTGASLIAQLLWIENQKGSADFAELTGAANPVSGLNAGDAWRVFNLFYRQSWGDDRFALKIGQLAIDDDFMGSDYAGLFAHSASGAMPSQVATGHSGHTGGGCAYPIYAVAAPGVHVSVTPADSFSLQLGVYHGGPGHDRRANHGFDWDDGSGQGLVAFYEGAYSVTLAGKPSTLRAGGALHTGKFDDFAALATNDDAPEVRGLHSFYLIQDMVLLARDTEHPTLAAFWRVGLSPQRNRSAVRRYADAGLNWFAPIPGRADDIAGLAISYTEYGDAYRRLDPALAAAETAVELTYRAQLTGHLALQGIVQRHFNPLHSNDGSRRSATVFALRAELAF